MSEVVAKPALLSDPELMKQRQRPLDKRHRRDRNFRRGCQVVACVSASILVVLLVAILVEGLGALTGDFLRSAPSPEPSEAGLYPALMGSLWLLVLTIIADSKSTLCKPHCSRRIGILNPAQITR